MTDLERQALTDASLPIVAAAVAGHGGDRGAALREIIAEATRVGWREAAAAFARSARDWADSLDGFDNTDRHHTRDFADFWTSKAGAVADGNAMPLLSPGEAGLREAALWAAGRGWAEAIRDAAAAARAAYDEMARLEVDGPHCLHRLADRWSIFAAGGPAPAGGE